jgi:hypothetical protein
MKQKRPQQTNAAASNIETSILLPTIRQGAGSAPAGILRTLSAKVRCSVKERACF